MSSQEVQAKLLDIIAKSEERRKKEQEVHSILSEFRAKAFIWLVTPSFSP